MLSENLVAVHLCEVTYYGDSVVLHTLLLKIFGSQF